MKYKAEKNTVQETLIIPGVKNFFGFFFVFLCSHAIIQTKERKADAAAPCGG